MNPIYGFAIVDSNGNAELLSGRWTLADAELEAEAWGEEHGGEWHAVKTVTQEAS